MFSETLKLDADSPLNELGAGRYELERKDGYPKIMTITTLIGTREYRWNDAVMVVCATSGLLLSIRSTWGNCEELSEGQKRAHIEQLKLYMHRVTKITGEYDTFIDKLISLREQVEFLRHEAQENRFGGVASMLATISKSLYREII